MAESALECNTNSLVGPLQSEFVVPHGWHLRPAQEAVVRAILRAYASGKKVVAVQGPTGSGKSLIGVVAALNLGRSYYLVPLKALQDQIASDFASTVQVFKGKANYTCTQYPSAEAALRHPGLTYTVASAPCQERGMNERRKICRREQLCEYYVAFDAAAQGNHALFNFSLYLAWSRLQEIMPERAPFVRRNIHVIDEAHKVEEFIRDFLTVELSTKKLRKYFDVSEEVYRLDKDTIFPFVQVLHQRNEEELAKLREMHGPNLEAVATEIGSDKLEFHLNFGEKVKKYLEMPDNYVYKLEEKMNRGENTKYVVVKPLNVGGFIREKVCGDLTLLLSATLPRRAVKDMGFSDDEVEYIDMASTFPAQNRLIKFRGVGRVNKENAEELVPAMARETATILQKYDNAKGIIHAPSYRMAELLHAALPAFHNRLLLQDREGGAATKILHQHMSSSEPTVLLSPGMKEGIDLKNDLSRFQIILKCPYPNLGDPAVKALAEKDFMWYITRTIIDFTQMYGRSIRSAEDFAETICLDDNLRILLRTYKNFLPHYVMEAVRWVG